MDSLSLRERHPWMGVEMRLLATLATVARTSSFRIAALELGYVQSTVSDHVAALERVVGVQLVERRRGKRPAQLTRAGERLAQRGEAMIAELLAARVDVEATGHDWDTGQLRIVLGPGVSNEMLTPLLTSVAQALPLVGIMFVSASGPAQQARLLQTCRVDMAIGMREGIEDPTAQELFREPLELVVPAWSGLSSLDRVTSINELDGHDIILPPLPGAADQLIGLGLARRRLRMVPSVSSVAPLVSAGLGVGVVPAAACRRLRTSLVAVPQAGLLTPRSIVMQWNRARRNDHLIQEVARLAREAFGPITLAGVRQLALQEAA